MTEPYNPLSKPNLAKTIAGEILGRPLTSLAKLERFHGAGVYALYYGGELPFYARLRDSLGTPHPLPIYVGKAIPEGGRVGGLTKEGRPTAALYERLRSHAKSINAAEDLADSDFMVRYLTIDDIWIPLGENMLIETFAPVWNRIATGFGNNPLGKGRKDQRLSAWDVLHPGRATSVAPQNYDRSELQSRISALLAGARVPEEDYHEPAEQPE